MTILAGTSPPMLHDAETLTDEDLRDLFAYPADLRSPLFRANFIASIDGAVTFEGSGRRLGTPTDRRVFGRLREVADVVLVGATTAWSNPYVDIQMSTEAASWRLSRGLAAALPVAVVSSRGVLPPAVLANPTAPPVVLVSENADAAARRALHRSGARVAELPGGRIDSAAIRNTLAELGLHRVLVEGGPTLFSQLVSDNEIDELCLTTSPKLVAGPARRIAAADGHVEITMQRKGILAGGDGTVIVWWARC